MNQHEEGIGHEPLVSICIPVFNGGSLIFRALESCMRQTYRHIEVVVSDNASTDDTAAVVASYAARDGRVRYYRNAENIGPVENFFRSYELASGAFVQPLGHDDWLMPNYVEECVKCFNRYPGTGLVTTDQVSVSVKDGDREPSCDIQLAFKNRNVATHSIFRGYYKVNCKHPVGLGGSMGRRDDYVGAHGWFRAMGEDVEFGRQYYQPGYAFDGVCALKVLTPYPYAAFTNKTAYVKLTQPKNSSKLFPFDLKSVGGIVRFYRVFFKLYEHLYSRELKRYDFGFRTYFGAELLNTLFFKLVKNRFTRSYFAGARHATAFFQQYSAWEKIAIVMKFTPLFFARLCKFSARKIWRRKAKLPHSDASWRLPTTA